MADIKKKIREIELSYDYNHSKEDYDVVVNLTEICTLFESVLAEIRNNAIDEFVEKFIFKAVCEGCSGCCNCHEEGRQSECEDWKAYMEIAEEMRGAE